MTESLTVPGISDDETRTLNHLVKQLNEKSKRNRLRSNIYDGKRAVKQLGTVIPAQYTRLAQVLGWGAKGVDGLARRCNLDRFVWADGDIDSLGIRELADSNFLFSEIGQGRTDSLLHGVSYLITTRGLEGEPKSLVHARDGLNATGDWNPRKRALDNLLSVTSRKDDTITGFVLYLDGETISAERNGARWAIARSTHGFGVPADPLVYRPRSSRRMGRSRISRPVIGLQDAALRAVVRLEAHMDIYSIPKLIVLGADEGIFKNADGSPKTSWQVILGRSFGIPDDDDAANPRADVKQFSAESPEPHLAHLNALAKLMARETDLPDSDFALTDMANPTSADAYNASRENLIAEAEGAMDDWSPSIRRTVTRALAIQNGETSVPEAWASIDAKWRSPIYLSRAAQADAGSKQLGAGPEWLRETKVGLRLLGLSEQDIDEALAERRRNAGREVVAAALAQRTQPPAATAPEPGNAVGA